MCDMSLMWSQLPEWVQGIAYVLGGLLFIGSAVGHAWASRELAACEAEAAELKKNPDLVCRHIVPTEEARARARRNLAKSVVGGVGVAVVDAAVSN